METTRSKLERQLTNQIYPLRIPLPLDKDKGWKLHPIFKGFTSGLQNISCHASVLIPEHIPHPPHRHKEEELHLVLSGEINYIFTDEHDPNGKQQIQVKSGQFIYSPSYFTHTLQTTSKEPANYLVFKWYSDSGKKDSALAFGQFSMYDPVEDLDVEEGFHPSLVFEGSTDCLKKLQCHTSTLTPGSGYDPHIDTYDVVIIILEGEVETLDKRVGPYDVIFYSAGEPHGIFNPSGEIAKYIVFEFHWHKKVKISNLRYLSNSLFVKLKNPRRWKKIPKHLFKLFSG
jgi:mannose-6-phosphate isomerase-like protein (cupin superfamily)